MARSGINPGDPQCPSTARTRRSSTAYWMPFTANRQFKANPRLLVAAEGMHYTSADGRKVLDGTAGLWCVNAGHGRRQITEAVSRQLATLDYAPSFQMGHPIAFDFASGSPRSRPARRREARPRLLHQLGLGVGRHRAEDRARLPARHRPGHPHPAHRPRARLSRGGLRRHLGGRPRQQPPDVRRMLPASTTCATPTTSAATPSARASRSTAPSSPTTCERLVDLHGAETIAAVIVEPVAGSTGVLPPPKGYLRAAARDLRRSTASCSSSTRSSPASAASARRSPPTSSA